MGHDSAVPKLNPKNRGYLILAEQKEQEDIDLATAINQSKSTAKNSDIEISKMVDESKSDGSGSWEDLAEALALSLKDNKPAVRTSVRTSTETDQKTNLV